MNINENNTKLIDNSKRDKDKEIYDVENLEEENRD